MSQNEAYEFARYLRGTAAGRMPSKPKERALSDWGRAILSAAFVAITVGVSLAILFPAILDVMGGQ
jgi:hypothetical protein